MKASAENGLSVFDLSATAYQAYRNAMGDFEPNPDWDRLDDEKKDDWLRATSLAIEMIEEAQELPWEKLAEALFRRSCLNRHGDVLESVFRHLATLERASWEAVGRHLANLIDSEEGDLIGLEEHEAKWRSWAETKVKEQV